MAILTTAPKGTTILPDGRMASVPVSAVLAKRGPLIQLSIGLFLEIAKHNASAGKTNVPPVTGMGLIDTGAGSTCIDEDVARRLNLPVVNVVKLTSATHSDVLRNVYPVTFDIPGIQQVDCPLAIGVPLQSQGIIALIGRDILSKAALFYNGPTGQITISF
jgi:predicted aspartyl protease